MAGVSDDTAIYNFEQGLQGWVSETAQPDEGIGECTLARDSGFAFAGTGSMKVTLGGATSYKLLASDTELLQAGDQYSFNVFIPSDSNITALMPYSQDGAWSWDDKWIDGNNGLAKGNWFQITYKLPADALVPFDAFGVMIFTSDQGTSDVWFDSISKGNFENLKAPACPEGLTRGVNLGNALDAPEEGLWGVILKEEYFSKIKEAGFDFVRIPVQWSAHAKTSSPYTIDSQFFSRVDWAINQAFSNGLSVVLDVHHYDALMQSPTLQKARFISIWTQIANRYKDYSDKLYFELLNEPYNRMTSTTWNNYLNQAITTIRKTNPNRYIIVGPVGWNSISNLEQLVLPDNDRKLIATVHYYDPFEFTHQGAEWVDGSDTWLGTTWTETELEKQQIVYDFDIASEWAARNDRPMLLGEFGAYSKADMDSRAKWTNFVAREAEKRNISWAYWEFCSSFGVYDPVKEEYIQELLHALIP